MAQSAEQPGGMEALKAEVEEAKEELRKAEQDLEKLSGDSTAWAAQSSIVAALISSLEGRRKALNDVMAAEAGSHYFIQPAVQLVVAAATFIVEVKDAPAGVGMGIFFSPRRGVTADHNFPPARPTGTQVMISFPETAKQIVVCLVSRNTEYDFAILEARSDRPYVEPALPIPQPVRGTSLILASFRIGIAEHAALFDRRLGFVSAEAITICQHGHHVFFSCPTFAGDPGAAILLRDGKLVGLHTEIVNALRERLECKSLVGQMNRVEASIDAIVRGGLSQGCVAVMAGVFASS